MNSELTDLFSAVIKKLTPKAPLTNGLCAVGFTKEGLAFARIEWVQQNGQKIPVLKACEYVLLLFDPEKILHTLMDIVKKNHSQGMPCHWVLQSKDYELISIPNLPVATEELSTALRWHIKDQIDFPITEAVLDYFKVPYLTKTQNEELIYVVVAKKNYLELISKIIVEAGLNLVSIEIPDLALRNAVELFSEKKQGIGILEINQTGAKLILMQDGYIYLIRQIEMELHKIQSAEELNVLASEIQRSCDYYENGLGQLPISKLVVISSNLSLGEQLSAELNMPVDALELSLKLTNPSGSDKDKIAHCLYAIGAALHVEEA